MLRLSAVALLAAAPSMAQIPSFPPDEDLEGEVAGDLVTRAGTYGATDADWGFLLVPENRAVPQSRLLRLVVVRQRAAGEASFPPIFNLVGGPGNSNVWGSGEFAPRFHERNDVVRVGYRGIDSDVELVCPEYMLEETGSAAQVFDAFAAAANGDYAGLALLSFLYDDYQARELRRRHGPYHGEFFSKVMSSGLDPDRDWIAAMDPAGSILGSPGAKLLWGAASGGGWPIRVVPEEYRRDADVDVETLVLMGNLDVAAPVEYVRDELMPHLERGSLVVLSDMAHVDFVKLQPEAFNHLAERFFYEGAVDGSKFTHHEIDFTPAETLADQARHLFPQE